ncbi:MAG: Acetyltransferase (GNAT) family protein [Methanomethylovorans sp. PtaU1.Bin073]|nr:MAG: Acetyltransferase (GNAT) family protein [Methanomethylovorans sp. PtaU1.Bin073]
MSQYLLEPMGPSDQKAVIDIFNHYIENSFAAYPEQKVPYEFFGMFLEMSKNHSSVTVKDSYGTLLGFGMLRPHNPMPAFSHTVEITYFIKPEFTGRGLGAQMLEYLTAEGKRHGVSTVLASISSLNEGSIRFHKNHGFRECGKFQGIAKKKGVLFDIVWMQKEI